MIISHMQENPWMAKWPATAITGNAGLIDFNLF
jgi:hypothetical protein